MQDLICLQVERNNYLSLVFRVKFCTMNNTWKWDRTCGIFFFLSVYKIRQMLIKKLQPSQILNVSKYKGGRDVLRIK